MTTFGIIDMDPLVGNNVGTVVGVAYVKDLIGGAKHCSFVYVANELSNI